MRERKRSNGGYHLQISGMMISRKINGGIGITCLLLSVAEIEISLTGCRECLISTSFQFVSVSGDSVFSNRCFKST